MLLYKYYGVETRVISAQFETYEKNNCKKNQACQCVLLIHGLGDTAHTWTKTLIQSTEKWSVDLHMYAINLPGSMGSPKLSAESDYSLTNMSQLIGEKVFPLCKDWVLIGNSLGGWLSIQLSFAYEQKIKAMVLTAPAGLNKDYSHILNYFLNPTLKEIKKFAKKTYYEPTVLPDFVYQSIIEEGKKKPVVEMLKAVKESDYLDDKISKNKIPTLLIWGDSDGVVLTEWAKEFHEKYNNSKLKIIEKCGHIPQKECFEEYFKITNEFFKINI